MSIFANNEFRTICTQTDPVNTSDEDEDLYEELDFPEWVFLMGDWKVSRTQLGKLNGMILFWVKNAVPIKTSGPDDRFGTDC